MSIYGIDSWRNIVEILFFSALFYQVALWLKKDHTKNLLPYFYGLMLLAFGAHILHLPSISYIMLVSWPIALMLFIVMHQKTLQHNLIALKNIQVSKAPTADWIETVVAHCLTSLNNNTPLYCVIENSDALDTFLHSPLMIEAPLQKELLAFIKSSSSFNPDTMLWVNSHGIVRGINCTWRSYLNNTGTYNSSGANSQSYLQDWKNDTLLHTSNTDTLALFADPATRSFTLIHRGKVAHHLNAQHVLYQLTKEYKNRQAQTCNSESNTALSQNPASQKASVSHQTPSQK
jgi:hypothetical protein